jgi:tRNA/rRNA methyltransferase
MIFILNRPQMGENIGSCMRVMANFGFTELRLVLPRDGWPNDKAITNSADADKIVSVVVFDSVEAAVSDVKTLLCFTARARFIEKPSVELADLKNLLFSHPFAESCHPERSEGSKILRYAQNDILVAPIALMFGQENNGLSNKELLLADYLVHIGVNPHFSSLNLSHAVGVVAHYLSENKPDFLHDIELADKSEVAGLLARLINELVIREYFSTEHRDTMESNIRALFGRTKLSSQEIRTLHGVIKSLTRN